MALNPQVEDRTIIVVRGLSIFLNVEHINRVTTLLLGIWWSKEDKAVNVTTRKNFFFKGKIL